MEACLQQLTIRLAAVNTMGLEWGHTRSLPESLSCVTPRNRMLSIEVCHPAITVKKRMRTESGGLGSADHLARIVKAEARAFQTAQSA
jgi:hypothetical protein